MLLGRLSRETGGVAGTEFALLAPLFLLLLAGITDLTLGYNAKLKINAAVSAAAYYAFQHGQDVDAARGVDFLSTVSGVVKGMLKDVPADVSVEVRYNNEASGKQAPFFYCVSGYPPTFGAPVASSVDCGSNVKAGKFVSISVQGRLKPVIVAEALFGSYIDVAVSSLVRVR